MCRDILDITMADGPWGGGVALLEFSDRGHVKHSVELRIIHIMKNQLCQCFFLRALESTVKCLASTLRNTGNHWIILSRGCLKGTLNTGLRID